MNNIYIEDNEDDNPFDYIDPSKLEYTRLLSIHAHTSKYNSINCAQSISLINQTTHPILYKILNAQANYTYEDFYKIAIENFIQFNEEELSFISKNFSPKKYEKNILTLVIEGDISINRSQFNSLLQKNFIQDFNDIYIKGLLAKYAIDNFATLKQEEQSQLWQQLNLNLHQNAFLKTYFFTKSIEQTVKITDAVFFKNTESKNNQELYDYFTMAINNQWSDNIVHFTKHFSTTCLKHLYKQKNFTTQDNINFERLFLYYNPAKIHISHLDQENINLVFSKLYDNLADKNLLHPANNQFLKSLDIGIYKLLEIANKHNRENVQDFLYSKNQFLFSSPSNSQPSETIISLFHNINKLTPELQESFHTNLLNDYLPSILNNTSLQSNVIHNYPENSFAFQVLIKENYISNEKKAALIHVLFENYTNDSEPDNKLFFAKLNSFPLESLLTFEKHLAFTLHILKVNHTDVDDSLNYVEQTFNKILLNAKLNNTLDNETELRKAKPRKI